MADVTTSFAAKDAGFSAVMQRLEARLAGFSKKMNGIAASSKKMGAGFSGLQKSVVGLAAAYVGVSQAMSAFNKALEVGGRLDDLSKVTGETAGNIMLLEKSFDLAGAGADKVGMALAGMARFVNDLNTGQAGAVETAKRLGITMEDLAGKTPTEQMRVLLEAIGGVTDANQRLGLSMDVFKKVGKDLIPLAVDFNGELEKARDYLGSTPEIMTKYADKLATIGDHMQAIGEKGYQLMTGFLAGASGIDDMTEAIARFDAAAVGMKLGKLFSGALEEPHKAFLLMGEILLLAVKVAGNELINATVYAGEVWKKALTDKSTFGTLMDGLLAGFQMIFNFAAAMSLKIIKTLVEAVAGLASIIPVIGPGLGKDIAKPLEAIEGQEERIAKQAEELRGRMIDAMFGTAEDVIEAAKNTPRKDVDALGAEDQKAQVDALIDSLTPPDPPLRIKNPNQKAADAFFTELNEIYREKVEEIHAIEKDRSEQLRRLELLRKQYKEKAMEGIGEVGYPRPDLMTPEQQMNDNALPQNERDAMQPNSSDPENKSAASEPTLKKAVDLLAELNQKLPQTALV